MVARALREVLRSPVGDFERRLILERAYGEVRSDLRQRQAIDLALEEVRYSLGAVSRTFFVA